MTRSCQTEHISLFEPKHNFRVRWCYQLPYQGEFDPVLMVCVCVLFVLARVSNIQTFKLGKVSVC